MQKKKKKGTKLKRCDLTKQPCDKFWTCRILGECVFLERRVCAHPAIQEALVNGGPMKVKEVNRHLEQIMPTLKRMNDRRFMKPWEEDRELNDQLYDK